MFSTRNDSIEILASEYGAGRIDRRRFLAGLGILAAPALLGRASPAFAQDKQLIAATWGGATSDAIQAAMGDAFLAQTGITVKQDGSGPSEGAVLAQIESGKIAWDVMQLEFNSSITLGKQGKLGAIDYNVVSKDRVVGNQQHEWAVASFFNTYVLVYDKATYGDNPPRTWADFFDTEKFPGTRTIPKWLTGMPEAALVADGVAPDQLYPLDLDRAFAKIETLMPHVSAVWSSGSESQQLMLAGDATMGMLWGARASLVHRETDGAVTFAYDNGFLFADAWSYPVGNPAGAEAANQFIALAQDPQLQLEVLRLVGLGPANPETAALVPEELQQFNPTQPEHVAVMHNIDMEWYADNYAAALDRYTTLVAG